LKDKIINNLDESNENNYDENLETNFHIDDFVDNNENENLETELSPFEEFKFNFDKVNVINIINKLDPNDPKQNDKILDYYILINIFEGKKNEFHHLEKKYKTLIKSAIRKMIKDEEDINDLIQETFIKAYNALHTFQFGYSFSSWIYRIASNCCIDFMRKKKLNTFSINQKTNSDEEYTFEIEDNNFVPDLNIINSEKSIALRKAIENLPDNYKLIIKLRHEDDLDYSQISEKLDLPLGTVKAHLFRARKLLFESLKDKQYLFVN